MKALFTFLRRVWQAETFSPTAFVARAIAVTMLFAVSELLGLREYTTFLSGTSANVNLGWSLTSVLGLTHLLLYVGFILLAHLLNRRRPYHCVEPLANNTDKNPMIQSQVITADPALQRLAALRKSRLVDARRRGGPGCPDQAPVTCGRWTWVGRLPSSFTLRRMPLARGRGSGFDTWLPHSPRDNDNAVPPPSCHRSNTVAASMLQACS